MPHGTPDWADAAPRKTVYGGIDLAEHAARLTSIVTFDRRGDVIWLDGFESGLGGWVTWATIDDDYPTWSSVYKRNGGFSCKLSTSAILNRLSTITHSMPIPVVSRIGLEVSFSLSATNTIVQCSLYFYDGATEAYYAVRYNQPDKTLEYFGTDFDWHVFAEGVNLYAAEYSFNTLKLVVDLEAMEFLYVILNSETYSMAGLIPWNSPDDTNPLLQVDITLQNPANEAKVVYVDDVIITQNEP